MYLNPWSTTATTKAAYPAGNRSDFSRYRHIHLCVRTVSIERFSA